MTNELRFERHLPAILEDLYLGPSPDYRDEVLAAAVRTRQRPAWTFPERWFPMADIADRSAFAPRVPWRSIGVALIIAALLAAAAVAYIGSHRTTVPAPFGVARNGLIAYAAGGDIYAADPTSGSATRVVTGPETDRSPAFSRDGTHVAFLRQLGQAASDTFDLLVAKADGSEPRILTTAKLQGNTPFEWSPDGTYLVATTSVAKVVRYDVSGSAAPVVISERAHVQSGAFRPPDGRQILYQPDATDHALYLMNADGSGRRPLLQIPSGQASNSDFGAVRWSPDGTSIAFLRAPVGATDELRVFVMQADGTGIRQLATEASGKWFETDLVWSPDGKRIAFDRWQQNATGGSDIRPIGVVSAAGGPVTPVGPTPVSDGAWFDWSPDGASIVSISGTILGWPNPTVTSAQPILIDATTGASRPLAWTIDSAPSWQRLAP